jgi:uncharacterized membrane protein YebE (DUF533 family)
MIASAASSGGIVALVLNKLRRKWGRKAVSPGSIAKEK